MTSGIAEQSRAVHSSSHHLKRSVGLWMLVFYGLGTIVGAGIYIVVGEVAKQAAMATPLAFLAAGLIAACTGLTYAELSRRFPEAAGAAAYVEEGFNSPRAAQAIGFLVLATGVVIAASLARGAAGYLLEFVSLPLPAVAGTFVVLFTAIACLNVRESMLVAVTLTIVELSGLTLVIAAGSPALLDFPTRAREMVPSGLADWQGIGAGAFLAFFAYVGFENLANMAEEAKDPERALPCAIVSSIVISSVLYVSVAVIAVLAVPIEDLIGSSAPLAMVLETADWAAPEFLVVIALIAIPNGLLADLLMTSRLLYGMGKRGLAPKCLACVSARQRIPVVATLTAGLVTLVFSVLVPFGRLVAATSAMTLVVFLTVNLALWRLQKRGQHASLYTTRWLPPFTVALCFGLLLAQISAWIVRG